MTPVQLSIFDLLQNNPQTFDDYRGLCKYCDRGHGGDRYTCTWSEDNPSRHKLGGCVNGSMWMPNSYTVPRLCGNCEHHNQFIYDKDETHGEESPDIYCKCKEGSLNRRRPYGDLWCDGFGVGSWERQHEWDTCDRWEKDIFLSNF